jgi:Flp pilus assembly protein TadD
MAHYDEHVRDARARVLSHDFDSARVCLEIAVKEDGRRPEALNLLGVIEQVRGRTAEARTYWRMAVTLVPDYEPARENLRWAISNPRTRGALALG